MPAFVAGSEGITMTDAASRQATVLWIVLLGLYALYRALTAAA